MKIYCLDTNVLVESADALFAFEEHIVVIPFTVLIELDEHKRRADSVGQNARRCIRHIDRLREQGSLVEGVTINEGGLLKVSPPVLGNKSSEEDMNLGFFLGLLVGEGHFGGDQRQPQITVKMHTRHEHLLRWMESNFGGKLYGPYKHDDREFYQWMSRGSHLREVMVPLIADHLPSFDDHVAKRFQDMCEKYEIDVPRETSRSHTPEIQPYEPHDQSSNRDASILQTAQKLLEDNPDAEITLITNDVNMRLFADVLGIKAEGFMWEGQPREDDTLYSGAAKLSVSHDLINEFYEQKCVEIPPQETKLYPNQFLVLKNGVEGQSAIAKCKGNEAKALTIKENSEIWGLKPRNKEQRFALDMLMDKDIKLVTLIGRAGCGKAQPLDAKIATPTGWTTMGLVKEGDRVMTPSGGAATVTGIFPQGLKDVYRVTFSDGSSTQCCDEHLWYTRTQKDRDAGRKGSVKPLREIRSSLRYGAANKKNHSIPMTNPVEFISRKTPVDPYLMGLLLGDGCMSNPRAISITTPDEEIVESCKALVSTELCLKQKSHDPISYRIVKKGSRSNKPNVLVEHLRGLELAGSRSEHKFVPSIYKYNSPEVRVAVLQGLMDSDGHVSESGAIEFSSASKRLTDDVLFLVRSLGGKAHRRIKKTTHLDAHCLKIALPNEICPFRLTRKAERVKPRTKYPPRRYIESVELVGVKECKCILIDSEDHLYLTDDFIVTHNTLMAIAAGMHQTVEKNTYTKVLVSRPIQAMGKDIGYLPGTLEEKMAPWIQPVKDNLLYLLKGNRNAMDHLFDAGTIEIEALTYIRGRSIPQCYMIIDECQNLSAMELKAIITRVGEGTKIVLTGDIEQIDNPYFDPMSNGLTYIIEKFKDKDVAGHIKLIKGERSPLATMAAKIL